MIGAQIAIKDVYDTIPEDNLFVVIDVVLYDGSTRYLITHLKTNETMVISPTNVGKIIKMVNRNH